MKQRAGSDDPVVADAASFTAADGAIRVPVGVAVLAEALEHRGDGTFVADIEDWDRADETP